MLGCYVPENMNCNNKHNVEIYSFLSSRIFEDAKDIPSFEKFYFQDVESRAYKGYPLVGANIWPHSKNPLDTFFGRVPRALKCSRAITVLFPFLAGGEGSKVNANPLFPLATREKKKNAFFTPLGVISFKRAPCKNFPRKRFQRRVEHRHGAS